MTLSPERIGDKGQRFVAQYMDELKRGEWLDIGYSDTKKGARILTKAFILRPGTIIVRVLDRQAIDRLLNA